VINPLFQVIRHTLRRNRKSPSLFASVTLLLALGIGLNSAIFSLLDALLLRPLPVKEPNQLVRLVQIAPRSARGAHSLTIRTAPWPSAPRVSRTSLLTTKANAAARDAAGAHGVRCQIVSGTFFTALVVRPSAWTNPNACR
jgi:hypothetical protein